MSDDLDALIAAYDARKGRPVVDDKPGPRWFSPLTQAWPEIARLEKQRARIRAFPSRRRGRPRAS